MEKWILWLWLILAIACFIVGFWVSIFESFVAGKAYLYFILSVVFSITYLKKRGSI